MTLQLRFRVASQYLLPDVPLKVSVAYVNVVNEIEKMSKNTIISEKWKADRSVLRGEALLHALPFQPYLLVKNNKTNGAK